MHYNYTRLETAVNPTCCTVEQTEPRCSPRPYRPHRLFVIRQDANKSSARALPATSVSCSRFAVFSPVDSVNSNGSRRVGKVEDGIKVNRYLQIRAPLREVRISVGAIDARYSEG